MASGRRFGGASRFRGDGRKDYKTPKSRLQEEVLEQGKDFNNQAGFSLDLHQNIGCWGYYYYYLLYISIYYYYFSLNVIYVGKLVLVRVNLTDSYQPMVWLWGGTSFEQPMEGGGGV